MQLNLPRNDSFVTDTLPPITSISIRGVDSIGLSEEEHYFGETEDTLRETVSEDILSTRADYRITSRASDQDARYMLDEELRKLRGEVSMYKNTIKEIQTDIHEIKNSLKLLLEI